MMTVALVVLSCGLALSWTAWRFGPSEDAAAIDSDIDGEGADGWSPASAIAGGLLLAVAYALGLAMGRPGALLFFAIGYPVGASMVVQSWRDWRHHNPQLA